MTNFKVCPLTDHEQPLPQHVCMCLCSTLLFSLRWTRGQKWVAGNSTCRRWTSPRLRFPDTSRTSTSVQSPD